MSFEVGLLGVSKMTWSKMLARENQSLHWLPFRMDALYAPADFLSIIIQGQMTRSKMLARENQPPHWLPSRIDVMYAPINFLSIIIQGGNPWS